MNLFEVTNQIVDDYTRKQLTTALAELEMIRDGKACGCRNCATGAVFRYNSWIDFLVLSEELRGWYEASYDGQNVTIPAWDGGDCYEP